MFETTIVPFDLQLTADSGQCFRMRMISPDTCMVVAQDQYVQVTALGDNRFRFACDEAQYLRTWAHFFDTDTETTCRCARCRGMPMQSTPCITRAVCVSCASTPGRR